MNFKNKIIFYLLPFLLSGCGIIYTNVHLPRAYRSATPGDVETSQNDPMVTGKVAKQSGHLSYNTLSPGELPKENMDMGEVQCKSCQHGISIPFISSLIGQKSSSVSGALGDGSFKKALSNLLGQRPELRGIYDVKIDLQKVNILGIYQNFAQK
ncbi:MAG: hypothetical protein HYT97_01780 [Elusimicrobia bacterium]|nr:hypothetical protein [Elusimicrobiota bacterium]